MINKFVVYKNSGKWVNFTVKIFERRFYSIIYKDNYFCSICPVKNEFSKLVSVYFPFNFIVFLRYLDLNYGDDDLKNATEEAKITKSAITCIDQYYQLIIIINP